MLPANPSTSCGDRPRSATLPIAGALLAPSNIPEFAAAREAGHGPSRPRRSATPAAAFGAKADVDTSAHSTTIPAWDSNKRKMEDRRRQAAEKEAAARRATKRQILEDADYLITVWNERHANAQQCFPFGKPPAKRPTFITEIPTYEEWQKETGMVI
jgi:hypothetical protein